VTSRPLGDAKDALIVLQGQLIAVLAARNAEREARVADLEQRLARVERAVSRNSGNSSMPPSADDLPGKKPPEREPRRGGSRRPGKQPGAPGVYLAWRERPDKTQDMFPEGSCACGRAAWPRPARQLW
jgi:hypothetical protein